MLRTVLVLLFSCFIATSAMAQVNGFRYEQNTTHPGGDFRNLGTSDADQCANECARDSNCLSFSFDKVKHMCWLKNSVPPIEHNQNITSGVKEQQAQSNNNSNSMDQFNISQNTTLPGNDFSHFGSDNVEHCATQCVNESRCRAFAYDKVKRVCWLKDRVPGSEHNQDITSGTKR